MLSPLIQKALIVIVTIGILLYAGVDLMNKAKESSEVSVSLSETETASQDILSLVDKMSRMSIDSSVFSSQLFVKLIDFSAIPTPEAVGRPNPFAPIGSDQAISQTASVNSAKTKTTP